MGKKRSGQTIKLVHENACFKMCVHHSDGVNLIWPIYKLVSLLPISKVKYNCILNGNILIVIKWNIYSSHYLTKNVRYKKKFIYMQISEDLCIEQT